jgi:pimeloyl-ACP methyl ester carboxylesterase
MDQSDRRDRSGRPVALPGSHSIETERGVVEVARAGDGPPVVFIHGTPGGGDSSLAMGRFLIDGGFEVIAPSRPGYLGTPLDGVASIDDQADQLAALLDALDLEAVGLITWSGGGPSGYRLAAREPARVTSLVAFAAVSKAYRPPDEALGSRLMMKTRVGNWMLRTLADHAPKTTISATLEAEGALDHAELRELVAGAVRDDRQRDVVLTMARVVGDYEHRRAGIDNDLARFGEIDSLGLDCVRASTLVIHGDADTDVAPDHGEHAAHAIDGAELVTMSRGTHLCLFVHPDAAAVQARVIDHLRAD